MKTFLLLLTLLFLFSCGDDSAVVDNSGMREDIDKNAKSIESLEQRVGLLEEFTVALSTDLEALTQNVEAYAEEFSSKLQSIKNRVLTNERKIVALEYTDRTLFNRINHLRRDTQRLRTRIFRIERTISVMQRADQRMARRIQENANNIVRNSHKIFGLQMQFAMFAFFDFMSDREFDIRLDNLEAQVLVNASDISNLSERLDEFEIAVSNVAINLQSQITTLSESITTVVYPCGAENSAEILLQTSEGLVAYYQEGHMEIIHYRPSTVVPSYRFCADRNYWGSCSRYVTVPSRLVTTTSGLDVSFYVIDNAYLALIPDGTYSTTDGFSCIFTVTNGSL